jgi:hypothetical protein
MDGSANKIVVLGRGNLFSYSNFVILCFSEHIIWFESRFFDNRLQRQRAIASACESIKGRGFCHLHSC